MLATLALQTVEQAAKFVTQDAVTTPGMLAWFSGVVMTMGGFIAYLINRQNEDRKQEREDHKAERSALTQSLSALQIALQALDERERKIDELVRMVDQQHREVSRIVNEALARQAPKR